MTEKLNRRRTAAAIAIAVMVITVFASGAFGLSSLRSKADGVFYNGVSGDGLSIYGDLNTRLECAYNIGIVAQRAGADQSGEYTGMMSAYDSLSAALERDASREDLASQNQDLDGAVEKLYRALDGYSLSDTDESLVAKQYRTFLSADDTISHDGYNSRATDFNDTLSGFPANLIAAMTGIKPLELFR